MKEIHDMCELENTSIFPIGDEKFCFCAALRWKELFEHDFNATGCDWKCYL